MLVAQVPLFVAFEVSDVDWGWGCIIDFCAGGRSLNRVYFHVIMHVAHLDCWRKAWAALQGAGRIAIVVNLAPLGSSFSSKCLNFLSG